MLLMEHWIVAGIEIHNNSKYPVYIIYYAVKILLTPPKNGLR
jgi:hypothetical protein